MGQPLKKAVALLTPILDKEDRLSNSVEKRQVTEVSIFYHKGTNLQIKNIKRFTNSCEDEMGLADSIGEMRLD